MLIYKIQMKLFVLIWRNEFTTCYCVLYHHSEIKEICVYDDVNTLLNKIIHCIYSFVM